MLTQRLLAAIVLIPIVILCLFFLPLLGFAFVVLVICALAAWEWTQFLAIKSLKIRYLFTLIISISIVFIYYFATNIVDHTIIFKVILLCSLVWWGVAFILVVSYPRSTNLWKSKIIKILLAYFTLLPFFVGMVELRGIAYFNNSYQGAFCLLYVLVLVWATDSGAYFAGRSFGKYKLAPKVSPGKTIEGFLGGVILSLIISIIVYFSHYFPISFFNLIMSSIFAILASVVGDLTESMFKRDAKIKDSGHLIPGHGGILDRIDSLTAAVPVFAAISLYLI